MRVVIREIWKTQDACAVELGIHPNHLSDILRGKYPVPGALLRLIADKGYSVDAILGVREGVVAEDPVSYCAERLSDSDILGILQKRLAAK